MATLKQIKQRIRSAKNIQQITRAMKLVSAAKFKKATDRATGARPYHTRIHKLLEHLFRNTAMPNHMYLAGEDCKNEGLERTAIILITAERGLAGSYNTNVLKKTLAYAEDLPIKPVIIAVGKKGQQFFTKHGFEVKNTFIVPNTGPSLSFAQELTDYCSELFTSGNIDKIYVSYNKFISALRQVPDIIQLLPIEPTGEEDLTYSEYEFEPNAELLLDNLLPKYLLANVLQALLEANASEHGARMTAMTSATDNANTMIHDLTLLANRERQARITKEILEVVSGAEALR